MKNKKKNTHIFVITFCVFLAVFFLSVGFSAQQVGLDITDITAVVRVQKDIRITGISTSSTESGGQSSHEDYNVSSIVSDIVLPDATSTVSYDIVVKNLGNIDMGLTKITGLPNNLTYTIDGYSLGNALCDDTDASSCNLGSTTTLHMTIQYKDGGFDSAHTSYPLQVDFLFEAIDYVARIGEQYYTTMAEAIAAVPDNTKTTIVLLKNTSEALKVNKNQIIEFDLQDKTLSNNGNAAVIENLGTVSLLRGFIKSSAASVGAINNQATGVFDMKGGSVVVTGGRQALYNNKGVVTISGDSYLSSVSKIRGAVQNVSGGTMTITGGTIVSTGFSALVNAGTMTLGEKDEEYHLDSIVIQGNDAGVSSTANFTFYDGIIKGKNKAISDVSKVKDTENGMGIVNSSEVILGDTYEVAMLGSSKKVTFNPNGGIFDEASRFVLQNHEIGPLPVGVKSAGVFDGWYTSATGGEKIDEHRVITEDVTFYAHFIKTVDVAKIGDTIYDSLQDAIDAAPSNTPTTIQLLKDAKENVIVDSSKNLIFDFDGFHLQNCGNRAVIANDGTLSIVSGSILSDADYAAIDQNSGQLNISGGRIVATGTRQAIYIVAGTVNISGDAYLSSDAQGVPTNSSLERGTIQCLTNGTLVISGGTIVGTKQQAVSNEGSLTIGTLDGQVDDTTPILRGYTYGLRNAGTFKFYDGIVKGGDEAISGEIAEIEEGKQLMNGLETIDGKAYKTQYLN